MAAKPAYESGPRYDSRHCLLELPYRALAYVRPHADGTPLYQVAGSAESPRGAEKALRLAHDVHGGHCFYCKEPVKAGELTIDHVEPIKNGGTKQLRNLVVACKPCNSKKADQSIEAFSRDAGREWLSAELARLQDRLNRI